MAVFRCPQCTTLFSEGQLADQPIRCPRCGTELRATVRVAELRELQRNFAERDSLTDTSPPRKLGGSRREV